ncbi:MAG: Gx transporter family protein [Lachnospiraceae bacterium]|nr:Gx transporter family protein [Lachnospiraceae bacterium]MCR4801458.1 Gx transporter family protein [Lachnospiraceae bacterium]
MKSSSNRVALYGMCVSLAFILSYIESMFPMVGIPGMKLGLTNMVVLFALYSMNAKSAFMINILRIFLVAFTFGNLQSLWFALAGGMLSFIVMVLLKKLNIFGIMAVSVSGSVFHNVGQILVAMIVLNTTNIIWYLGVLCISGVVAGSVVGILTGMTLSKLKKHLDI